MGGANVLRRLARAALSLLVAVLVLVLFPITLPLLYKFAVDEWRYRIETKWQDSDRAHAVSSWIGVLAPFALLIVYLIALYFGVSYVHALKRGANPV
jgi:TRAP-type C4-dicarboxylate transport system permease small subunit